MTRVPLLSLLVVLLGACDSSGALVLEGAYAGIDDDSDPVNPVTLRVTITETESPGTFPFTTSRVIRGSFDEIILRD